jgi:hypothetical protein
MISKIAIFLNSYIGYIMCCLLLDLRKRLPFFLNLKRISLVFTRDLRITGEVDDICIGDLNTYVDFVKFNKAGFFPLLLTGLERDEHVVCKYYKTYKVSIVIRLYEILII